MARIVLTALLSAIPIAVGAHHSVGVFYESESSGEVTGTVTQIAWVNPHIRLTLESADENGDVQVWNVEAGSVNSLERNGIQRDSVAVGSEVTVTGRLSRLGRPALYATAIRVADGEPVALIGQFGEEQVTASRAQIDADAAAQARSRGIFRVWLRGRAYGDSANFVESGLDLPYTPEAVAARGQFDPLTDDTALECIPQGMPGIMDNPFPIEFLEQGDTIVLKLEEWDTVRTIHMSADTTPATQPAAPLGYSVGRREDDTLVVTTTRIDWPFFDDVGTPQSAETEIIERFSLSADGSRLDYSITVADPMTFTEPVTLDGYWVWAPGQEIKPYNCTL